MYSVQRSIMIVQNCVTTDIPHGRLALDAAALFAVCAVC